MITTALKTKEKMAYSVREVSEITSLSLSHVKRQIKAKNLRAKKTGARVFVLKTDLQNWLDSTEDWNPKRIMR
jgi:excisionase family DNA binding protein